MSKCLVTKLKASVDNENLPTFGTFDVHVVLPTFSTYAPKDIFVDAEKFQIIGDGHWVNSLGEDDPDGEYLSTGDYTLRVFGKYGIRSINTPSDSSHNWGAHRVLRYSIESLQYSTLLGGEYTLNVHGLSLSGDIAVAFQKAVLIRRLNLASTDGITGDFAVMFKRMIRNGFDVSESINLVQSVQTRSPLKFNGADFSGAGPMCYLALVNEDTIGLYKSDKTLFDSCLISEIPD